MISVSNLVKKYGAVDALNGISFNIKKGEFYGLLGPNGAGKTTTISILSTIVEPTSGEVTIAGFDLRKNPMECKKSIGVVSQEIALYEELSAYENLMFWGGLYKVPKSELKTRITETLDLFGLVDRMHDKIKTYSGGMKRRINIASSLLHRPQIIFMDEPTVGVDPQSRNLIFEVLEKLHNDGMTIIYTTHYMEEAERFCDRIGIIDNGAIIAEGTLDELRESSKLNEIIVVTFTSLSDADFDKIVTDWTGAQRNKNQIEFHSAAAKNELTKIVLRCNELGLEILHLDIQKVNLESIFLSLTGKQLRD